MIWLVSNAFSKSVKILSYFEIKFFFHDECYNYSIKVENEFFNKILCSSSVLGNLIISVVIIVHYCSIASFHLLMQWLSECLINPNHWIILKTIERVYDSINFSFLYVNSAEIWSLHEFSRNPNIWIFLNIKKTITKNNFVK